MMIPSISVGVDLKDSVAWRMLNDHIRHQRRWIAVALACMVVFAGCTAVQAWLVQPALDEVFINHSVPMLVFIPIAILLLTLVKGATGYGQDVAMSLIGQRIIADLQKRLFKHLIQADLGYFLEQGPGPLISGLTYDTQQLRTAVSSATTGVVKDLLSIVGLTGVMFYQDWRLAAIAFIGIPLSSYLIYLMGRRMRKVAGQCQAQMARLTARLEQTFRGVRQVKADSREADEAAFANELIEKLFKLNFKAARVQAISSPLMDLIGGFAISAIIAYGGWQVTQAEMTPGAFFSFIAALLLVYRPLKSVAKVNTQIQQGLAAAERIYTVLDRQPMVKDAPDAKMLCPRAGEIRLDRVTFGYLPSRPILHTLDLIVPAGKTVALVGHSGGGKSTILNLILRFYDVEDGAVLIDGQDIRHVTLASLRSAIALVSQDVDLFDDTVRANIAYGRRDATEADVIAAAEAAAADGFIRALPHGYDTIIGPSGATLSGGQRQRLGIARAMIKNAPILLLDEATSALDSEAERMIQTALNRLMQGRTSIVIAHRLSTIIGADLIAVIEDGRIVERGRHADLLRRGGTYAKLYEQQFADQQSDHLLDNSGLAFSAGA